MSRRRRIVALLALCVAASMALGVGGYSSVSAERNVTVAVAPPEAAYLGLAEELQCNTGGDDDLVRNQFAGDTSIERIEVEIMARGGYVRVGTSGPAHQLGPGESVDLTFTGPYDPGEAAEMRLKPPTGNVSGADVLRVEVVEATGTGVRVIDASQTYEVNCPGGSSNGISRANASRR
jgi:hypothetical protein